MKARVEDLIDEADHLEEDEQLDEALATITRVFAMKKLAPAQRVRALMTRASIYDDLGDRTRALADCDEALAIDEWSADVWYLRSTIHQGAEDWAASLADLDVAIKLEPIADFFESRGLASYNLGNYKAARADFATAFAGKEEAGEDVEPRFHVYRGMAALLLDDPRDAVVDFSNALELDADNVKALAQRAKAYEACGNASLALADLDRLRKLLPRSPLLEAERARVAGAAKARKSKRR